MLSGVTRHMLPHVSWVPHLHVNRLLICLPFFPLYLLLVSPLFAFAII